MSILTLSFALRAGLRPFQSAPGGLFFTPYQQAQKLGNSPLCLAHDKRIGHGLIGGVHPDGLGPSVVIHGLKAAFPAIA